MSRVLVFGGTTEARKLLARGFPAICCVATAYGAKLLEGLENVDVRTGRLDKDGIVSLIRNEKITLTVDATHPYALEVTRNIRGACSITDTGYIRVIRPRTPVPENTVTVGTPQEAASWLEEHPASRALLTVGSKELPVFAQVTDAAKRFYPRVLPTSDVITQCESLGFDAGHIIALQGPFTTEMNEALLRSLNVSVLVTKDGGTAGGTPEKFAAAASCGVTVLLIDRRSETGLTPEAALLHIRRHLAIPAPAAFPMLISLEGRRCVIAGGGKIALRRARTLLKCGADVTVISPEFTEGFPAMCTPVRRKWRQNDIEGAFLAVAATNDRSVNSQIATSCRDAGIPVSVADNAAEGTFMFPALITSGGCSVSVSTNGISASLTHALACRMREIWPDTVREIRKKEH